MASACRDRYFSIFISSHCLSPSTLYTHFQKTEINGRSWISSTSVCKRVIHHGHIDFTTLHCIAILNAAKTKYTSDMKASLGWKAAVKEEQRVQVFLWVFLFVLFFVCLFWFVLVFPMTRSYYCRTNHAIFYIHLKQSKYLLEQFYFKTCFFSSNNLIILNSAQDF